MLVRQSVDEYEAAVKSNIDGYNTKQEWFLGSGSFGAVYKAEKDGKYYALKIFRSELLQTEYKKRIDVEIKAISKVTHPNVVKLYGHGKFSDQGFDYFYIVMDFIEGVTLTSYVGNVSEIELKKIIKSMAETLEAIHKDSVIHRDLKPDNVIINSSGVPIILDLGLAKLIDYSSITQTGERIGSYAYMSPEQVTDSKNIDARSDYFAVGVIMYQMITGVLPYDATNLPALIEQIKNEYPSPPSNHNKQLSNSLENVILKLLEKQPYQRYQSLDEMVKALDEEPAPVNRLLDRSARNYLRLLNNEKEVFKKAVEKGLIKHIIFPANFFKGFKPTLAEIKKSGVAFTTDPATNRLVYSAFSKTKGLVDLPYSSGSPVSPLEKSDFKSISQIQEYVKKVLEYQVEHGVGELAAPFFYSKNTTDSWYDINLKLLKESVEYRNKNYPDMPLWGAICMNVEEWHDPTEKQKILNDYVKISADGYFVYGDPISSSSNLTQLYHYADLLLKLQSSSTAPVVACRVNGFGLILLAFGVSGISSGIGGLDSFSESILSDKSEGYAPEPRYFIPELMSMVSLTKRTTAKIIDIQNSSIAKDLLCDCGHCAAINGGFINEQEIKLHFLTRRKREIDELLVIDQDKRVDYIEARVDDALAYLKTLGSEKIKIGNLGHLKIWKELITELKKQTY